MEIATKEDIAAFKKEILEAINVKTVEKQVPVIIHTDKVQEILGGVSYSFVTELRRKGTLNPTRVGNRWLWSLDEVLSLLPKRGQNI